jgi:3-deoxy-D-manno-octulosonate 8-phosphate phosphatase (KDO 8-P phosphatase)
VRLLILDVDGVLTEGQIVLGPAGMELKHFDTRDGLGIILGQKAGIKVAFITGRASSAVENRAKDLGVRDCLQGRLDKLVAYQELLDKHGLADEQVAFVGDDLLDLPALKRAGLKVAVPNASWEVKAAADYVTIAAGGHGAVREVVEMLLGWRATGSAEDIEKK